jgi:peptide/nickel transport system permease protein
MRLGQGVVSLFVLGTLVFVLARLIGNPVDMMLPTETTLADREWMINKLGLDRPYYVQYGEFMWGLLRGDLGESIKFGKPVTELFLTFLPNTFRLGAVAITMAMVFGFSLGMLSAIHRGSAIDHAARAISVIGMSAPAFWVGLMLMLVFAVRLGLVPVARMGGLDSYILPGFTLSLFTLAGTARLVRSTMVEVLDSVPKCGGVEALPEECLAPSSDLRWEPSGGLVRRKCSDRIDLRLAGSGKTDLPGNYRT